MDSGAELSQQLATAVMMLALLQGQAQIYSRPETLPAAFIFLTAQVRRLCMQTYE
jgi:hypothetical protein